MKLFKATVMALSMMMLTSMSANALEEHDCTCDDSHVSFEQVCESVLDFERNSESTVIDTNHICTFYKDIIIYSREAYGKGTRSGSKCFKAFYCTYKCDSCPKTRVVLESSSIPSPHDHCLLYSATCNGTVQTHYFKCWSCYYNAGVTRTLRCPKATHSGPCRFLPV